MPELELGYYSLILALASVRQNEELLYEAIAELAYQVDEQTARHLIRNLRHDLAPDCCRWLDAGMRRLYDGS